MTLTGWRPSQVDLEDFVDALNGRALAEQKQVEEILMAYNDGSPVTPGTIYYTTVTSGAPTLTTYGAAQYSFPVSTAPTHEMLPLGFRAKVSELVSAYEEFVAHAHGLYPGVVDGKTTDLRARIDELKKGLSL